MFSQLLGGISSYFTFYNILLTFGGVFLGICFGGIPGLTATMGLALLVPLTFTMSPEAGLILLGGLYVGAMYGDAIPAILINTPGSPAAIATTFDGYPLTQKGKAQQALMAAAIASALGSLLGNTVLALAAPPFASFALLFGPAENFWLGILGLTLISSLSATSLLKGLLGSAFGLLISCIGMGPGGSIRLSFGLESLQGAIPLIVSLIGFFCLPEVLQTLGAGGAGKAGQIRSSWKGAVSEVLRTFIAKPLLVVRSAVIGTVVGFAPGAGGNIAGMVSYNEACRFDRSGQMGKGKIEGVIASETSNSAMAPGSLIPLLTLGIPGSPPAAVLIGALMLHSLRPGYELFSGPQSNIIYLFIASLMGAALAVACVGVLGSSVLKYILRVPAAILMPAIVLMSVVGSYAIQYNLLDVKIMFLFGIVGFFARRLYFHPAPIVLGLILGPLIEEGLVQSALKLETEASLISVFLGSTLSRVLCTICLASAFWPFLAKLFLKRNSSSGTEKQTIKSGGTVPVNPDLALGCFGVMMASTFYFMTKHITVFEDMLFVRISLLVLTALSLFSVVISFKKKEKVYIFNDKNEYKTIFTSLFIIGLMIYFLDFLGFIITSLFFNFFIYIMLSKKTKKNPFTYVKAGVVSILLSCAVFYCFQYFFEVYLPTMKFF